MNLKLISLSLAFTASLSAQAQHVMDVNTSKIGAPVQSTMYGIFFEDINYAADGGLYAELIMNRSFEFPNAFAGWDISGKVTLKNDGPFERNPHYVRLAPAGHNDKHTMIENQGFFGIGVKGGEEYRFSARWWQGQAVDRPGGQRHHARRPEVGQRQRGRQRQGMEEIYGYHQA